MNPKQTVLATRPCGPTRQNVPPVLVVGEINPYRARPDRALWYEPRSSSGDRLRRIMGLTDAQYLEHVARANLCAERWSAEEARAAFRALDLRPYAVVVLLGARVRAACGGPPPFTFTNSRDCPPCYLVGLPHPSGRCRIWNDPLMVDLARTALERAAPGIPWGTAEDKL
jgi:hypothetical protein